MANTCFPPEVAPSTLRSTPRSRHRRRINLSTTAPDLAQDDRRELTGSQPRRASLRDIGRSAKLRPRHTHWAKLVQVPDPSRFPTPSRAELQTAYGKTVPDLVGPGMRVLLCGINPSLWSGLVGYHFARPSNRLWPVLHQAGFTSRRLHPSETDELVAAGLGVTNLVARATARADELTPR